jgi:arylsulfatase A-like enzyme
MGLAAAATALGGARVAHSAQGRSRPNFLFILADDLGYADLSCYGRRDYETPVLDRLAADGMRFTQGYSNSAVCSPTRLALATGRYQYRLPAGLAEPIGARAEADKLGLHPDHPSLPSLLRKAGYRTALLGKWHLGELPEFGPLKSGYEQFYGISGGGTDYVASEVRDGERPVEAHGYLTEVLTDKAVDYVRAAKSSAAPFLLSLHYTAPHWPWQAPGDGPVAANQRLFHLEGGSQSTYARMVGALDSGIGRVLKALRDAGLERSTLVVFSSDNGGERFSDNWPFTGQKMDLLEGGIRVPLLARWKGEVPAGVTTNQVAITMDWLPTFLSLAQTTHAPEFPPDGVDLSAVLRGGRAIVPRTLFWRLRYRTQAALRAGDWKYLSIDGNEFLFDLASDPRERANRRQGEPQRFAQLQAQWQAWNAQMLPLPAVQRPYIDSKELAGYHDSK